MQCIERFSLKGDQPTGSWKRHSECYYTVLKEHISNENTIFYFKILFDSLFFETLLQFILISKDIQLI